MSSLTTVGQRWSRTARVSLTLVLLSAVAVVGFTLLGAEVLAAWQAPNNADPALASGGAFAGLVNLEAPAAMVGRLDVQTQESVKSRTQAHNAPLLLKNWKYTQNPTADAFQTSWTAYLFGQFLIGYEAYLDTLPLGGSVEIEGQPSNPVQQFIDQVFTAYYQLDVVIQAFANSFLPPAFRSPPLPPASPFL